MEEYIVKLTAEANKDMEQIYDYIAWSLLAPESALNQYNRIAKAVLSLNQMPERCPLFDCEPEHSRGIHKMIIDNYTVCYIIDNSKKEVFVLAVLYGASDIHSKLQNRQGR